MEIECPAKLADCDPMISRVANHKGACVEATQALLRLAKLLIWDRNPRTLPTTRKMLSPSRWRDLEAIIQRGFNLQFYTRGAQYALAEESAAVMPSAQARGYSLKQRSQTVVLYIRTVPRHRTNRDKDGPIGVRVRGPAITSTAAAATTTTTTT
ncbi:hypothetical protein EJ06DRAFT_547847 [Trichodelitschia bisporula]|uniref:Uncharacterized protein n=1 Tax=Trichodelitschia bisporula TaxID=703511 RepID=A0A6G1I2R7_9PEZI|nr:hypothetical protein EJ06DRAFT_547847 [Trichodelitschia bisporula]